MIFTKLLTKDNFKLFKRKYFMSQIQKLFAKYDNRITKHTINKILINLLFEIKFVMKQLIYWL